MKPKMLDSILHDLVIDVPNINLAKAEIIELFKSCVPKRCERENGDCAEEAAWADGCDFSTNWTIKNIEELR